MKLKNILMSLVVIIGAFFAIDVNAKAPEYFEMVRDTNYVLNYYEDIVEVPGETHAVYFPLKYSKNGNYLIFCTADREAKADNNTKYTKTTFVNDYDGAITAAIIKTGVGENATKDTSRKGLEKAFFTQLAIWKSLPNTGKTFLSTEKAFSTSQREFFNKMIAAGAAAKIKYIDIKNFSISLNSTSLNFTLNADVYESQVIKVSGKEIKTIKTSVNMGEVVEKDGGYVIRIAKNKLSEGKNKITFKADATSNSIAVARNYTNGKAGQQTTTITGLDYYSNTASASISGEIVIKTNKVPISKVDATNQNELPGAKLELTYPDGHTYSWLSESTPKEFILEPGTYKLRETLPPTGYIKSDEVITFEVDKDGKVAEPVVMVNYPLGHTVISKIDATNGEELPGAKLILKDENGNEIKKWTSGTTPEPIYDLQPGKYYLTEIQAPDGYITSKETITFTVDKQGKVETPAPMKNYPKGKVPISKQDATTQTELEGATLILKDANGEVVEKWISGNQPHFITLDPGTYYLTEIQAPDGYITSEETITFEVDEEGNVKEPVIMYNKKIPKVPFPNTSSFKTITTSIIGIITIILGAVTIYRVYKKNEA